MTKHSNGKPQAIPGLRRLMLPQAIKGGGLVVSWSPPFNLSDAHEVKLQELALIARHEKMMLAFDPEHQREGDDSD